MSISALIRSDLERTPRLPWSISLTPIIMTHLQQFIMAADIGVAIAVGLKNVEIWEIVEVTLPETGAPRVEGIAPVITGINATEVHLTLIGDKTHNAHLCDPFDRRSCAVQLPLAVPPFASARYSRLPVRTVIDGARTDQFQGSVYPVVSDLMRARSTGKSSCSNQGLRRNHGVLRADGCGNGR
jgi:hypothetical protein